MTIARLLKDGSFIKHDRVHHLTILHVRPVTEPQLPVNLDGEIAVTTPTDFTIERNAVHVVPWAAPARRSTGRAPRTGRPAAWPTD